MPLDYLPYWVWNIDVMKLTIQSDSEDMADDLGTIFYADGVTKLVLGSVRKLPEFSDRLGSQKNLTLSHYSDKYRPNPMKVRGSYPTPLTVLDESRNTQI